MSAAADDASDGAPGVVIAFEPLGEPVAGALRRDVRVARLAALAVPSGEAPTPFLAAGPFRATLEGFLSIDFFDDYTFALEGRGTVTLEIDGETLLDGVSGDLGEVPPRTVELEDGRRKIMIRYESPADGDASLRLLWSSLDFATEPVHPSLLSHDPARPDLREAVERRRGRELIAERRCAKCHLPSRPLDEGSMPELADDASSFEGIGARLDPRWMARWIDAPRAQRADARMPRVFVNGSDGELDPRALDVAAYLATLAEAPISGEEASDAGTAADGEALFDALGCVGCHRLDADDDSPAASASGDPDARPGRVSLAHAAAKWRPGALARFLGGPARHHASIRMPDFGLSAREAASLAAFLVSRASAEEAASLERVDLASADVERGRGLVETSGCLACHTSPAPAPAPAAPKLSSLEDVLRPARAAKGCLATSADARGTAPNHELTAADRNALLAFARSGAASLWQRSDVEYAARRVRDLRCTACHQRDGRLDVWSELVPLEDEATRAARAAAAASNEPPAKLLQLRPLLTWTGEKLRPEWLARFLDGGSEQERVRPWLDARMPRFALRDDLMARGLALEHGVAAVSTPATSDADLARVGEELMARPDGGFACTTCHDRADALATGTFDAKGPNLADITTRLRHGFFHRWMRDPLRVDPRTKMPQFAVDGRTPLTDVFEGDARRQFEAIWHALAASAR